MLSTVSGFGLATLAASPATAGDGTETAAPAQCTAKSAVDKEDHRSRVFASGWLTCPVQGTSKMVVSIWRNGVQQAADERACGANTNCATSSPSVPIVQGSRFCARAAFYFSDPKNPHAVDWNCKYY
ncbi:MAG: hypothetical protein GEU98_05085 [Pseudonocardiaceae bacterium]|nr:hypothetical protein [Pseudonocardiaceae bacterium]